MEGSSQRYISFIASLIPLYQSELVNGQSCARNLRDGTLLLPRHDLDESMDDDWITVWWQGDPKRASDTQAFQLASIALVDYVQLHSVGKGPEHAAGLLAHLGQHYEHKTGGSLYLPYADEGSHALGKIVAIAKEVGFELALEGLKEGVGL